ncbi:unnamed protein product [Ectocarpus sp. 8 AP-2014]
MPQKDNRDQRASVRPTAAVDYHDSSRWQHSTRRLVGSCTNSDPSHDQNQKVSHGKRAQQKSLLFHFLGKCWLPAQNSRSLDLPTFPRAQNMKRVSLTMPYGRESHVLAALPHPSKMKKS